MVRLLFLLIAMALSLNGSLAQPLPSGGGNITVGGPRGGFGSVGPVNPGGPVVPQVGCILADVGVCLLADTGVKLLVQ